MQRCYPDRLDGPDDDALAAAYAWPDRVVDRPVLRANMVSSIDGAIAVDGRSAGLGSDGDQRIFAVLRDLADVLVVGAGTIRAEGYGGIRLDGSRLDRRRRWGLGAAPRVAVVTGRGLDRELPLFADPDLPPIVVTTAATAARMSDYPATVVAAGHDAVDLPLMVAKFAGLGLRRLLCEGGPALLGHLIAADLLDELCLTTSPQTLGTSGSSQNGPSALLGGVQLPTVARWKLNALHVEDGNIFSRYSKVLR